MVCLLLGSFALLTCVTYLLPYLPPPVSKDQERISLSGNASFGKDILPVRDKDLLVGSTFATGKDVLGGADKDAFGGGDKELLSKIE